MADCDNDQECEKIVPTPIKPEPLPKQCSGGGESGEGTNDFNELENRPKYGGRAMTGDTNIPEVETYEDFVGTDGEESGTAGLVPAPEATDVDKFLKSDGTWAEAGGGSGINVVQTTGTSPDDVMSQKAVSTLIYPKIGSTYHDIIGIRGDNETPDPSAGMMSVGIGAGHFARGGNCVSIGFGATVYAAGEYSVAIGNTAKTEGHTRAVALGNASKAAHNNSVAIGTNALTTRAGEVNVGAGTSGHGFGNTDYRVIGGVHDGIDDHDAATVGQLHYRQRKPVVVWEVDGEVVTTGLVAVGEDISANPNWQLTDLDLTPYKRIKIFTKAAQKAGTTASASTTPAMVLEMSLDPRAAIAEYGGNYVGSMLAQKPNDANRLCTLTCAVSADKTKFEVLRMTNLYGTAATSNSDVNAYVFKIEGYYD